MAHTIAEEFLSTGANLEAMIGTMRIQEGFDIEITEEMVDAVNEYVMYVSEVIADMGKGASVRFEEKVELTEVNSVLFGTADCVIVKPFDVVHVFDLKYGQGKKVSAWKNKQLMYYVLGVMLKEDCSRFVIHICQPRVEDGFTFYQGDINELNTFHAELEDHVKAALDPKAPLIPGDHCRGAFCPNRTMCPGLSGLARSLTVKDFSSPAVVDTLSLEHITKVLKYEDTVKDWMSKVKDHAKEMMLQGLEIPGYKITQSQGNAKWLDEDVIKAEFDDEYGDKMYEKKLLSVAKFEKMAGKKRLGKDFREGYTIRPNTGYKIVEEDAKGEPIKIIKAQDDF